MKKLNANWIGFGLLAVAWGYSAVRYTTISRNMALEEDPDAGKRVVRVLHWQLEPGYREGLQLAIDAYNALPHVQKEGVEVRQLAVTERVYAQFINVHLISGTAPDICVKGQSSLLGSSAASARFFEPISGFVKEPNPYNAPEYLEPNTDPTLAEFLQKASWNETFVDGMLGGWDDTMQDYYMVPVSSWGALRVFVNLDLVAEIKTWMATQWTLTPRPEWMTRLIDTERMVTADGDFVAWIQSPEPPATLGRFFFFNEAATHYAAATPGREKLVPISASSYPSTQMTGAYIAPFTNALADRLDNNRDSQLTLNETLGNWQAGLWTFDDPALRDGLYDVVRWLNRYFPRGFLGLDREQSLRRFLSGQAVFISTGAWDAATLFNGAEGKFRIAAKNPPMPAKGERWFEMSAGLPNEAESRMGVPMSIYKNSKNKEWALDFLRFITSHRINQKMNQRAGWIPAVVGARPIERMMPFLPRINGVKPSVALNLNNLTTVGPAYDGQFPRFQTGTLTYDEFARNVGERWNNPRSGIDRMWHEIFVGAQDKARQNDRAMVLVRMQAEKDGWDAILRNKQANLIETSLRDLDGFGPRANFKKLFPERDYPTF